MVTKINNVNTVKSLETQTEQLDWMVCDPEHCYDDEVVTTYRDFTIALCVPNGGIVGITIWNKDKSVVEIVDTEIFDKYCDEDWHIEQAKSRINQIFSPSNQLSLF